MNTKHDAPSCLLLGYSGFSNTGSEVRILTIIDDIRACFGSAARITVATPAPEKTARILPRDPNVSVARFPLLFPLRILQLVARHDITFLVEGSTFQQNWSSALRRSGAAIHVPATIASAPPTGQPPPQKWAGD